jgi:cyanophycinase-like exopeptidase
MKPSRVSAKLLSLSLLLLMVTVVFNGGVFAQENIKSSLLLPIGGGYNESLPSFSQAAIAHHHRGYVNILVLPITLASQQDNIPSTERQQALDSAENLRSEIEAACQQEAGYNYICKAEVVPVITREDAQNSANLDYFTSEISAIFIPDGDANIAMHVIGGTLIEGALVRAHQQNVVIAGTGAGGRIQSVAMLQGYQPGYQADNALNFNAVSIFGDAEQHGLLFGFQHSIIDSNFYEDGNIGRLLNAIHTPGYPHLGIGVDAGSGFYAPDGQQITNVFGRTGTMLLDAETYHAAQGSRYLGCGDTGTAILPCTPILSTRNVLVGLLAPGVTYDLINRQHSLSSSAPIISRDFASLRLPARLGRLILSGGIDLTTGESEVLNRFAELAGGSEAKILILSTGFQNEQEGRKAAQRLATATGIPVDSLIIIDSSQNPDFDTSGITGILVTGPDASLISPEAFGKILQVWETGVPLLLDDAAATLAGEFYANQPVPANGLPYQGTTASRTFLSGQVTARRGLSLLPVLVETSLMSGNRWGRLFSLAHQHPDYLAVGLNKNSALEISQDGATVLGENAALILDLRKAQLGIGKNAALVIANGLLDVFAPGEFVQAVSGSVNSSPQQAPTPVLVTATPTASPTATSSPTPTETPLPTRTPKPTRTLRPTATPPAIPPPSNPNINQWMIAFSTLVAIVIVFGLILNRRRLG